MRKFILMALLVVVLALVGGVAWLIFWDPPAPTRHIERSLDPGRFPG
ncbi:MAG: hypothetical protein ACOY99_01035 [Pseudomonadota bacterium]|jgi:type II secretory pathway component PulM